MGEILQISHLPPLKSTYSIRLPLSLYCLWFGQANAQILQRSVERDRIFAETMPVLPSYWQTPYLYLCCALICGGVIYLQIRLLRARAVLKKESRLYDAKINFFAEISHDVRTHLSLIEGRLVKALGLLRDDQVAKHHLDHARQNSQQIIQLLNELLDYHRIGNGSIKLSVKEYDLVKMIETILSSFEHIGIEKGISTRLIRSDAAVTAWFDISQMQKVFYNLLANAFKFTPENGWVTIEIDQKQDVVIVSVTNSGSGIAPKDIGRMFDKFFQGQESGSRIGHGMGLALSKSIVDLHHAKLSVTSREDSEGRNGRTCFSVTLLTGASHFSSDQFARSESVVADYSGFEYGTINLPTRSGAAQKIHTVLLIEDNDELRALESDFLSASYHVRTAINGSDGFKMALESIPDLILCDVVLPDQNGTELCSQLKADERTAHIPIILLTAQSALPQVILGLQAGADDYLVQPVDMNILLLKIQNLIRTRTAIRSFAGKTQRSGSEDWLLTGINDEFIDKLRGLVIENISQPDFGVNEMAFQVGMSVSVLYRKVRSLTGMTVNDFMKAIKMQKALQLLESGSFQVNEVAMMVGYESVRYFSNEFKKLYGKSPSKFRSPSAD